jgi:hypothetical protein
MFNITELDEFTADIPMPQDGVDQRTALSLEPAIQRLANRSKYLKSQAEKKIACQAGINGASVAPGSVIPLSNFLDSGGGFTVVSNGIQVPAAGWYLVTFMARVRAPLSAVDGVVNKINVRLRDLSATPCSGYGRRFSTSDIAIAIAGSGLVQIATPASQQIEAVVDTTEGITLTTEFAAAAGSQIVVMRVN